MNFGFAKYYCKNNLALIITHCCKMRSRKFVITESQQEISLAYAWITDDKELKYPIIFSVFLFLHLIRGGTILVFLW